MIEQTHPRVPVDANGSGEYLDLTQFDGRLLDAKSIKAHNALKTCHRCNGRGGWFAPGDSCGRTAVWVDCPEKSHTVLESFITELNLKLARITRMGDLVWIQDVQEAIESLREVKA